MPLLLAQISDTHVVAAGPRRQARIEALKRAIDWLAQADPKPAAVIHTGDLTHNARPEQYSLAKEMLAELGLPLIAVPGNRDRRRLFLEVAPPPVGAQSVASSPFLQFAMMIGDVRIVALDTVDEGHGLGNYCEHRFAHLASMLAEGDGRPTVVAMHHPPIVMPAVPGGLQFVDADIARRLSITIARDPTVVAILAGHVHRRATGAVGRASVETMPSIAVDLRKGSYPAAHADRPLLLLHRVSSSRVETRTVVLDPITSYE